MRKQANDSFGYVVSRRAFLAMTVANLLLFYLYYAFFSPMLAEHMLHKQQQHEPSNGDLKAHRHGHLNLVDYDRQHDGGEQSALVNKKGDHGQPLAIPFMRLVESIVATDRAHHNNPVSRWVRRCSARTNKTKGSNGAIPLNSSICSMANAVQNLRRKDNAKVIVPPQHLFAFTLNGTVPLLYEYRNDYDVLVSVRDGHVHKGDENTSAHDHGRWEEGRDYVIGRRHFTVDMLRQAYSDQLTLMQDGYRKHQQTREKYLTQLLLLESIERLAFFISGKEVAVFGSLERPDIEVALVTVGGAAKVHSVDYRPILVDDERIVGYEAYEFWRLIAEANALQAAEGEDRDREGDLDPSVVDQASDAMAALRRDDMADVFKMSPVKGKVEFGAHKKIAIKQTTTTQPLSPSQAPDGNASAAVGSFEAPPHPPTQFNLIVAFGSIQHDGLGRYGDTLDPFGDVHAMSELWSLLPVGGLLLLSVPVGNDCLLFNMYRVYGRRRLPLLLQKWEVVSVLGLDDRVSEELYYQDGYSRQDHSIGGVFSWLWRSSETKQSRAVNTRSRVIPRWEDSQCDGRMRNSPIFILRKIASRQATARRTRAELAKVPGLLGSFPLYHRPR